MPFELSNSLKSTCGWSFASKGMNCLFASRFYTTAILTIMIIILIMIIYPVKKNTPVWLLVKLGFYIFIVSLGMIFIHDCVIYHEYEKEVSISESENFIGGLDSDKNIPFKGSDDQMEVNPKQCSETDTVGADIDTVGTDTDTVGGDSEHIFKLYGV
jgi:hypothetical protein